MHVPNDDVPFPWVRLALASFEEDPRPDRERLDLRRFQIRDIDAPMVPRDVIAAVLNVEVEPGHAL